MPGESYLKVTQVRSGIGTKPKHRATLRALGLRGVGRSRVLPDRPEVRGMLARVPHLVHHVPAAAEEAVRRAASRDASREARSRAHARRSASGAGSEAGQADRQVQSRTPGGSGSR